MNRFALIAVAAFTMLSGSAYAQSPPTSSKMDGHSGNSMAACPMNVPGAQVSTASTTTGEALTFVTNTPAEGDEMMGGMMGSGHMKGTAMGGEHMKGGTTMPQSHATVADVDKGACMTLTPSAATDLKELRSAINVRAERMQRHGCGPMAQK